MSSADATASALAGAAQALHDSAREHKRAERHHRRRAREVMRELDELRATCERLGNQLDIDTQTQGGHSA